MRLSPHRSAWYAAAGAALSLGAPLGLLLLRKWFMPRPIATELFSDRLTYLYVFLATAALLASVGWALGRQADRLAALSDTDALTGLANRRALRRRIAEELARSRRYDHPISLLMIDVDGLKPINDSYGHAEGDRIIRAVADTIRESLRATDLGARWGGDEFAVVAPGMAADAAKAWAERLVGKVAEERAFPGVARATISIGVSTFGPARHGHLVLDEVIRAADDALYAAKSAGRNSVRVAS
jgi:two-component system, cell cycle response regulator